MAVRLRHIQDRRSELRAAPRARWGKYVVYPIAAGLLGFLIYGLITDYAETGQLRLHLLPLLIPMLLALYIGSVLNTRELARRPLPMLVATCLAGGRCGCCARELRHITPEPDGCVRCHACGSSWHTDRWAAEGVGIEAMRYLVDSDAIGSPRLPPDDRGVMLEASAYSREKWVTTNWRNPNDSPQTVAMRRDRRDRAVRGMDRVRERSLLIMVATGLVGAGVFLTIGTVVSTFTGNSPSGSLFALASLVMFFTAVSNNRNRKYRDAVLQQGLCPNCGMILSESARVEFDGCVSCAHCGRAWKAADIKQPAPTPPAPTPSREPWLDAAIARGGRGHG